MDTTDLFNRLRQLDTACVCDGNKALRADDPSLDEFRIPDPNIRPIQLGLKLVGRAHTVSVKNDFLGVIRGLRDAQPGEVLVIDGNGGERAIAGELFPTESLRKGLAGMVVDGFCRDTRLVREMGLPYYARNSVPIAGSTDHPGETQIPINCGGVPVNPGDVVFGDDDGLVVGTFEQFEAALPVAEEIQRKEDRLLAEMGQGKSFIDMLNLDEHLTKLEAGEESRLQFLV